MKSLVLIAWIVTALAAAGLYASAHFDAAAARAQPNAPKATAASHPASAPAKPAPPDDTPYLGE